MKAVKLFALTLVSSLILWLDLGQAQGIVNTILALVKLISATYLIIVFQVILHQLGHLIFGLVNKYEFVSVQFFGLSLLNTSSGLKFRFDKNSRDIAITTMVPKIEANNTSHINYYLGGYITSFIFLVIIGILGLYKKVDQLCLFFVLIFGFAYLFISMLPKKSGRIFSDSYIIRLLSNKKEESNEEPIYDLAKDLLTGKRPRDIEVLDLIMNREEKDQLYQLYMYYRALDMGNKDLMANYIRGLENKLTLVKEDYKVSIIYELICYYLMEEKDRIKAVRYFHMVENTLENDMDINGRRTLAYWLYYAQLDEEGSLRACKEGLDAFEKYPIKGLALMEKDIIEKLIGQINKPS